MNEVTRLIEEYVDKHPLALECGSEYISQSDKAQVDAMELVYRIFDALSTKS
jgi:hypothetical protein